MLVRGCQSPATSSNTSIAATVVRNSSSDPRTASVHSVNCAGRVAGSDACVAPNRCRASRCATARSRCRSRPGPSRPSPGRSPSSSTRARRRRRCRDLLPDAVEPPGVDQRLRRGVDAAEHIHVAGRAMRRHRLQRAPRHRSRDRLPVRAGPQPLGGGGGPRRRRRTAASRRWASARARSPPRASGSGWSGSGAIARTAGQRRGPRRTAKRLADRTSASGSPDG